MRWKTINENKDNGKSDGRNRGIEAVVSLYSSQSRFRKK